MTTQLTKDARQELPDLALLQAIRPSASRMAAGEEAFVRLLHEEIEPLVHRLPNGGWPLCERTARAVLWLTLSDPPQDAVIMWMHWLGEKNQADGFPPSEYVRIGHALVWIAREMSGTRWSTTTGSAWIRFFMWLQPLLQAGARRPAAPQQRRATFQEHAVPQQRPAFHAHAVPQQQAAPQEQAVPQQQATFQEQAVPQQQAAPQEQATPQTQPASSGQAAPQEQAVSQEQAAPQEQTAPLEEHLPETVPQQAAPVHEAASPPAADTDVSSSAGPSAGEDEPTPVHDQAVPDTSAPPRATSSTRRQARQRPRHSANGPGAKPRA